MSDNLPKPGNEQRIRSLERLRSFAARVSDKTAFPTDIVRLAKVVGPVVDGSTTSESKINVIWQYVSDAEIEADFLDRSASAQSQAVVLTDELPEANEQGVCALINGVWVWLGTDPGEQDPDTPLRQTVRNETDDVLRGAVVPVSIDAADIGWTDPHTLNLESLPNTGTNHANAVAWGTTSFFNEPTLSGESPGLKETSNGGFIPAIVWLTNAAHKYAVLDSRLSQPSGQKALASTPYGPYRIVEHTPLTPDDDSIPRLVKAVLREQVQDRDIARIELANTPTPFNPSLTYLTFPNRVAGVNASSRVWFPELETREVSPHGRVDLVRKDYVVNAPHPTYLVDLFVWCQAVRRTGTGFETSDSILKMENDAIIPREYQLRQYSERQFTIEAIGANDPGEGLSALLDQRSILLPSLQNWEPTDPTLSNTPYQRATSPWSVRMVFLWPENYKYLRFWVKTALTGLGAFEGLFFALTQGYVILHRLGDRGAFPGSGSRSLSGFAITDPELPAPPDTDGPPDDEYPLP